MKLAGLKTVQNAHEESIWALAWVPATDSRPPLLLSGSVDESVKIWGRRIGGGGVQHWALAGSGGGGRTSSGLNCGLHLLDSFVRVFDVNSNSTISILDSPPSEAWNMQFHPKGDLLAVAGGGSASVKLWDTATWRTDVSLAVPRGEGASGKSSDKSGGKFVLAVAWSSDGRRLACSTMDGTIAVFDVARGKFLYNLEGHYMPVRSLVFCPTNSRILYTASDDTHIHCYDVENKSLVYAMSGHTNWVLSIDVSPDGQAIASGSSDRTVRLWDLSMRASIQTMTNHTDQVWGVAFRPPWGQDVRTGRLASVSDDKAYRCMTTLELCCLQLF